MNRPSLRTALAAVAIATLVAAGCGDDDEDTIGGDPATEADAAAICQIYNQGIEDRLATLETELRTADERRQWLKARSPRHPVIVAERAEPTTASNRPPTALRDHAPPAPIAWASLNVFNARDAYRFVADISVYVGAVAGTGITAERPTDGKSIFTTSCGSCHTLSDAGTTGAVGPNLDDSKPPKELVVDRVTNGQGAMPSFKDSLDADQIQAVADYVAGAAGN